MTLTNAHIYNIKVTQTHYRVRTLILTAMLDLDNISNNRDSGSYRQGQGQSLHIAKICFGIIITHG